MRTREYIAWGAIIGMVAVTFTLRAVTRGPGPDTPGEATASVLGVVVDRVAIPPDPGGRAGLPTDRIMRGLLATMVGAAVASGCLGGQIGGVVGRSRVRQRPAAPSAAADPAA